MKWTYLEITVKYFTKKKKTSIRSYKNKKNRSIQLLKIDFTLESIMQK